MEKERVLGTQKHACLLFLLFQLAPTFVPHTPQAIRGLPNGIAVCAVTISLIRSKIHCLLFRNNCVYSE